MVKAQLQIATALAGIGITMAAKTVGPSAGRTARQRAAAGRGQNVRIGAPTIGGINRLRRPGSFFTQVGRARANRERAAARAARR